MRVACIGNMNNNFFSLVRYLRDEHIDADLLLLKKEHEHFAPVNDTFGSDYKEFCVQLSWGKPRTISFVSKSKIENDLKPYDYIIACGTSLGFIQKAGRIVDLFVPYGADLKMFPFVDHRIFSTYFLRSMVWLPYTYYHRKAIKNAICVNQENEHPIHKYYQKKLKIEEKTRHFRIPMVYNKPYKKENIDELKSLSKFFYKFEKIRSDNDLVLFHNSRHIWKKEKDVASSKGNNILIRGFSKYIKDNPSIKSCMVTFDYGYNVAESKELIKKLGIEKNVIWFELIPRKEIMLGMSIADFGSGHFKLGLIGGGTVLECLAMGLPLLHYRVDEMYSGDSLFPIVNVDTDEAVRDALSEYVQNKEKFIAIGKAGQEWHDNVHTRKSVDTYVELIKSKEKILAQ